MIFLRREEAMLLFCAFLVGMVAGLRTFLAPAGVSWAARLGVLGTTNSPLAFMGYRYTPVIFTVLAVGELIIDKLPTTPSRKALPSFLARIVSGALAGGTVGASREMLLLGVVAGALGAVVGTLGGAAVRTKLAVLFGKDLPAALLEDVGGILIVVCALWWLA
jgi:uncharacterized membrane protein